MEKTLITVEAIIDTPVEKVWKIYTTPDDVLNWNAASDDWHTTAATNDLTVGGKFNYRMEAKDGTFGFDFWGTYDDIIEPEKLVITLGDGRKEWIIFHSMGDATHVIIEFEAEQQNTLDLQRAGWQAILDRFANYVESK